MLGGHSVWSNKPHHNGGGYGGGMQGFGGGHSHQQQQHQRDGHHHHHQQQPPHHHHSYGGMGGHHQMQMHGMGHTHGAYGNAMEHRQMQGDLKPHNVRYVGGTAYFDEDSAHHMHGGHDMHVGRSDGLAVDLPPSGFFNAVDCRWKEVIRVPMAAVDQATRACSAHRHPMRDRTKKGFPNLCEDYHMSLCLQGPQCKLFHLRRDWVDEMRKPHQHALELARDEFHRIQAEGKAFTVFCPNLKETLPVPAHFMHFTRGLFLREEERVKRQVQHGGKHSESHQNPSVCQLFIKTNGDRQCKWGELCNQAHPHREWLLQRQDMSVSHVVKCKREFDESAPYATWEALDPDTNGRLVIQKRHLRFTRGLFAKENSGARLASVCMLYLKQYDGSMAGSGCTAGDLCNQIHVDANWLLEKRIEVRLATGDFDESRHRRDWYQGVHFPTGKRVPKWHVGATPPLVGKMGVPTSPSPSFLSGSSSPSQPIVSPATTALPTPADRSFNTIGSSSVHEQSSEAIVPDGSGAMEWFSKALLEIDVPQVAEGSPLQHTCPRPSLSISVGDTVVAGSSPKVAANSPPAGPPVNTTPTVNASLRPFPTGNVCSPINRKRDSSAGSAFGTPPLNGNDADDSNACGDDGFAPFGIESLTALMEEIASPDASETTE